MSIKRASTSTDCGDKTRKARNIDRIYTHIVNFMSVGHFNRLYLQIGAVNGSEEFRLGVSLNADVKRKSILTD